MTTPEEDVRRLYNAFQAAKEGNPDAMPYIGPEDTLNRFLDGAVVTHEEFVCDQSPFTMKAVLPAQMRRLRFMLDRSAPGLGQP